MDTVQLDGKGFISKVKIGDEVKKGQKILILIENLLKK
ncbi:PTS glucose transporter subunit IIA [Enterococcus faecalis]|nr:PTS glucose transporter subunit IIA [Enterococcus faecalis]